ncbi:MAG: MBL fold metallo-hydrolase [Solobacterium sp.]|nr:MBL fold metallo-hydrolase [Solobacterium sp.]
MSWIRIDETTYRYEDGDVRFFLLLGTEFGLLLDSGMKVRTARELAAEITSLPIRLCNTHADRDHIGSNEEFDEVWMSPAELVNYVIPEGQKILPVYDGDIIDPGNRPLEVIGLPGHTPGSIALLDRNSGMLFSGDPIQDGRIFMFGPMRNLRAYQLSLERLRSYEDRITAIYPCHGTCPVPVTMINELIAASRQVEAGEVEGTKAEMFGQPIFSYDAGCAVFLCDDPDLKKSNSHW